MKTLKQNIARFSASASLAALAMAPVSAFAQDANDGDEVDADTPIVVVGTLIRGTEAVGTQTISVDQEAVQALGANTTNEILSLIPQIANTFNDRFEVDPRGASAGITVQRPNLRSLPGINSSTGGTTLVLVDGFRLAPVGVGQSSIDVDIIPGAVLEGVDVLTDGGTSLYGADAVAGVINFRTMRSFDGIKADFNYGFGDTISGYEQYDGSLTAGTSWNGGNAYLSFGYSHRDGILNNETDWASGLVYDAQGNGSFAGTQCPNPVGTETRWFNFGAGFTNNPAAPGAGTFAVGTACDNYGEDTYLAESERYTAYGSLSQELGETVDLRVTGYYTKREQLFSNNSLGFTTAGSGITSGSALLEAFPEAANTPRGGTFAVTEGVGFAFSPNSAYENRDAVIGFETWGFTPELTAGLPADFQVRVTTHFGRSTNEQRRPTVDNVLAQQLVDSGALDPFNVAGASAGTIQSVTDFETAQDTKHQLFAVRTVVDGPLFALPGGDARIAIGGEYQNRQAKTRILSGNIGAIDSQPWREATQTAASVFAELNLPLHEMLEVSGSIRYDHYNDFGDTTNPNVGISFTPTDWLEIYGHWNTSFNAPTALDQLAQSVGRFTSPIYTPTSGPTDPFMEWDGTGTRAFLAEGSNPGLLPQTAESWAVGIELNPIPGLTFGSQWYRIDFTNILGAVNAGNDDTYETNPELYFYNPSDAFFAEFLSQLANGDVLATQVTADQIALLVDRRTTNISSAIIEGFDFHAYYNFGASFGDVSLGINGNIPTKSEIETSGTVNDNTANAPDFTAATFAAINSGGFSGRVTVNYTDGDPDQGTDATGTLISRGAFVQTNLSLGYEFQEGSGVLEGTRFRVIVDNIFETLPRAFLRSDATAEPYRNWSLGRVIKFGVSRRF